MVAVRALGYRRREAVVSATTNTVDFALARDVFRAEEIVVTGQATGVARRNLANAVATVSASDLGGPPTPSLEQQLQGKVAGADIQTNSGAPGGGVQVRLRGITSVNADAQPLYVVDGVVVADVAIASNQNAVTAAASGSNPNLNQDGQVNRIADLNPSDIQSIEILKGASAAAIYGGRASNGVVIITTKRGSPGAPRFNFTQRFGYFELLNKFNFRRFNSAQEIDAAYGAGTAAANNFTPGTFYDHEEELAGRRALSYETLASISGGDANTQYFASGIVKNDEGIIRNTGFQRQSIRVNVDQRLGSRVRASINANVLHTNAERGLTNNDNTNTSYYVVFSFTPSFVNLGGRNGPFLDNTFVRSNPLQTAALSTNKEEVWRSIVSASTTVDLWHSGTGSLSFSANGGLDYFNQDNTLFFPPELQFEPADGQPGTSLKTGANNLNLNLDGALVHRWSAERVSLTTSAGVQHARRDLDVNRVVARNLVGGQQNVNAGTNIQVRENRLRVKNLGFFLQEEALLLNERLLLTAGIRGDQSSLNADAGKVFWFPKAAASYRFPTGSGFLSEVKIRGAYGESGNEPIYGQIFTPLDATQNLGGIPGILLPAGATTGAPDLRYERQREFEVGIDAELWRSRAALEFTVYEKKISDLLLTRALAPSSGFTNEFFNGGKLRTRGVELAIGVVPVQSRSVDWLLRGTFSANRSKITELPVPPFILTAAGFGTTLGAFRIEEGASATQIVGVDTLPDGRDTVRKIGDANPDFRLSFTNDLTWKRFSVHVLVDYQQGSSILNLTKLLSDFGQTTGDYADPIPGSTETVGERRLGGFGRVARNYLESATFVKLREVSVSYELPPSAVQALWAGIRSARISLSARNLAMWTPYTGLDPEVSNFGNQPIGRNIDVAPFPPSRSFFFSVDLGF